VIPLQQFYNDQIQAVEAKDNYRGVAMDNATINESIYDWQDDPANCNNVTYNPFEKDPNICAQIPELSTVMLLGVGLLMLAGYLWMRRKGLRV